MTTLSWVGIAVAGAIGAPVRYLVDGWVEDRTAGRLPWGTFVVNVTGSFVLGVVSGLALYHGLGDQSEQVVGTGFCGALTTFSTFSFETVRLAQEGEPVEAFENIGFSLVAGLAAAAIGLALAAAL